MKPTWNLVSDPHQEQKISEWKHFSSIKMLEICFSQDYIPFKLTT